MNNPINNSVFDTRDLIEYREYLENQLVESYNDYLLESAKQGGYNCVSEITDFSEVDLNNEGFADRFEDDIKEYNEVSVFCDDLSTSNNDFKYGCAVIHESEFTDYCTELLEECGYISKDFPSWIEIDYEATADNMKADYTTAEYQGDTYYIR